LKNKFSPFPLFISFSFPFQSTFDPTVCAAIPTEEFGAAAGESYVLSHILGHNLCFDVFGDHSAGELAASQRAPDAMPALAFHGEAGQVHWRVDRVEQVSRRR
jgi:hypothetical protein